MNDFAKTAKDVRFELTQLLEEAKKEFECSRLSKVNSLIGDIRYWLEQYKSISSISGSITSKKIIIRSEEMLNDLARLQSDLLI